MKKSAKLISFLLAFVLVISSMPFTALADTALDLDSLQVGDIVEGDYDSFTFENTQGLIFLNFNMFEAGEGTEFQEIFPFSTEYFAAFAAQGIDSVFENGLFKVKVAGSDYYIFTPTVDSEEVDKWVVTSVGDYTYGNDTIQNAVVIEGLADPNAHIHTFGEPVWSWTGYESAQATFTCTSDDCEHFSTNVNATITSEVTTPPTPVSNGERTYTATATYKGINYTDTKTEEIVYAPETATVTYYDETNTYRYKAQTATVLTGYETVLEDGWYYTGGNLSFDHDLKINGDVHIIIATNTTLNFGSHGIQPYTTENSDDTLSVYHEGWGEKIEAAYISCANINAYAPQLGTYSNTTDINALNNLLITNNSSVYSTNISAGNNITFGGSAFINAADITAEAVYVNGGMISASATVTSTVYIDYSNSSSGNFYARAIVGSLIIAQGKTLTDYSHTNFYSGTYTAENISQVTNKYLYPCVVYTVTFKGADNSTIETKLCEENTSPTFTGTTPADYSDEYYDYTFSGWTDGENNYALGDTLPVITADTVYTAVYAQTAKVPTHTITWKNYDSSTIKSDDVAEGTSPVYSGETPSKPSEGELVYTFAGWIDSDNRYYSSSSTLPVVTEDAEYTAVFTSATVHTLTHHAEVTPTVSSNGCREYWSCDVCSKRFSDADGQFEINEESFNALYIVPYIQYAEYYIDGNLATVVTAYFGNNTTVLVPKTVPDNYPDESLRGKTVTRLNSTAFANNNIVEWVVIRDIQIIYGGAFKNCSALEKVYVGRNLYINNDAFKNCTALEEISTGYTNSSIFAAENAFSGCDNVIFYDYHDGSLKAVAEANSRPFIGLDEHTVSTQFEWNGYESAVATKKCEACDYTEGSAEAVITSEVTTEPTATQAGVRTYTATATIDNVEYNDTKTEEIPAIGEPVNYNLTVTDEIDVNFYVDFEQLEAEDGYIIYSYLETTDDKSAARIEKRIDAKDMATATGGVIDGDQKLTLVAAPAQIAEEYEIDVYDKDGNKKTDEPIKASIAEYCQTIINNPSQFEEKYVNLAKSILDYGQSANLYFDYASVTDGSYTVPTSDNFDSDITADELNDMHSRAAIVHNQGDVEITGISFVALMKPELRFYISETNEVLAALTDVSIEGEGLEAEMVKTTNGFCVRVTGLNANDFAKTFTLTIGSTQLTYNGYAYLYTVLRNESTADANLKALAKAVYRYAVASEAAFEE